MMLMQVPSDLARFIEKMNLSQPKLIKELLDESKTRRINLFNRPIPLSRTHPEFDVDRNLSHLNVMDDIVPLPNGDVVIPDKYKGVPQGSNLGPLLALLPMREFLCQMSSVSYADDGLFYSDEPFEIYDMPQLGIVLHPEKSGWVKSDGEWLKPLKFLGLVLDREELRAETRKGSRLIASSMKRAFSAVTSWIEEKRSLRYSHT